MKKPIQMTGTQIIMAIIGVVSFIFISLAITAGIVMALWNTTIPLIFPGVPEITFWIAFRLYILIMIPLAGLGVAIKN